MIPAADRRPARTGYVLTLHSGERLHIWPETDLVVSERIDGSLGAGVSVAASVPLRQANARLLASVWRHTLARWRAR